MPARHTRGQHATSRERAAAEGGDDSMVGQEAMALPEIGARTKVMGSGDGFPTLSQSVTA